MSHSTNEICLPSWTCFFFTNRSQRLVSVHVPATATATVALACCVHLSAERCNAAAGQNQLFLS